MKDPYATEQETVDFRIGRGAAYVVIYVFLLLITAPPLLRNLSDNFAPIRALFTKDKDKSFTDEGEFSITKHLKGAEGKFEDAPFTEPARRAIQTALTRGPLREGNTKTHIGKDGWLYFKTALDALSGYGPLRPEPDSVAKDPNRKPWRSPLDAITHFAEQLAETDTELLLVPIPTKPMIYPEHLGIESKAPLTPPDAEPFYSEINDLPNARVIDMGPLFTSTERKKSDLFLKQDTHWSPAGLELAVTRVAMEVLSQDWFQSLDQTSFSKGPKETRSSYGDLVEKFDIGNAGFEQETVEVTPIGGETRDTNSPVVLLGDSFTNIYSDAVGLDWGANAGFAEHLAHRLGIPLDVIAINGGGATEVREALAQRKGAATLMKDKKLVIWAIAARDLFLSESAAERGRIEWDDVTFDTRQPDPPGKPDAEVPTTRVSAKLIAKSEIDNPKDTDYTALLYAVDYELLDTLSGEPPETEDGRFVVLHWAFRDRKLLPSAGYEAGAERTMELVPFETQSDIASLEISNDSDLFVDLLWEIQPATSSDTGATTDDGAPSPALPVGAFLVWATALGIGLHRSWRAGLSH